MQRLNPIDAIAPAFTRTHQVLLAPFRVGRSWKLTACYYLAFLGAIFVPFPIFFVGLRRLVQGPALVIPATIAILVFLTLFYVCVRMEMVVFDVTVRREELIAPIWKRYGRRVWPWLGLKVLIGSVLTLLMAPMLMHAGTAFFAATLAMRGLTIPPPVPGQTPDLTPLAPILQQMVHLQAVFLLFFFVQKAASTILYDLVLPFYALEPISLASACARGLGVVAADPLNVALYLMMKLILAFIGYIVWSMVSAVILIPFVIVSAVAGAFGLGFVAMVTHAVNPVGHLLVVGLAVLFYGLCVAALLYVQIGIFGYLIALLESYAVYFLGGRYPLLGDTLEPPQPTPYTYTPPPSFPSAGDDDPGPPTPMDPALA